MGLLDEVKKQLETNVEPGKDYFETPERYEQEILSGVNWEVLKYGHKRIDHHAPYKQGQLTVIVGHTNVGKTYLILYLLSKLLDRKKIIIYSAENRISQIARFLIAFHWNNHEYHRYFKWLRERVWFIRHVKQYTYKDILEQIAVGVDLGFEADAIFIDPYNSLKIDSKKNGHEYHYEAIEDLRIFTQQTKKSIFLNCHTVTDAQRTKPDKDGEIPPPIMADVEGGAKFPNKADDVWVIHRNLYHVDPDMRYITQLHVRKVRNKEAGGEPTGMMDYIQFKFKHDWTGFETTEDNIAQHYPYKEPVEGLPF